MPPSQQRWQTAKCRTFELLCCFGLGFGLGGGGNLISNEEKVNSVLSHVCKIYHRM